MGFLDLIQRIGGGFSDLAQNQSRFNEDAADFDKHGRHFREIRDNELLTKRFSLSSAESNASATADRAAITGRAEVDDRRQHEVREEQARDSYLARMGSMSANSDVDSESSIDEFVKADIRANLDADRADTERGRRVDQSNDEVALLKNEDTQANFASDQAQSRARAEVSDENARLGLSEAKRRAEIEQRFSMENAELRNDALRDASNKRDAEEDAAKLKGASPKARREVKSGAAGGFNNRVDLLAKQNAEATKGILEDINADSQRRLQTAMQLTAQGGIGLLNPQGQPITAQDVDAIEASATANRVDIGTAAKELGYQMDQTGQNGSPALLAEIAGAPQKFMQQQAQAVAEGAVQNFDATFPGVLDAASAGQLLDANQMDALELLLETMAEHMGNDWQRYPGPVRDALAGIQGRRASQPVGQVQ